MTTTVVGVPAGRPAAASGSSFGSSRASAYAAYQNTLKPALAVPTGWNGSKTGCVAGSPSAAAQSATLTAVNFYRAMADLPPVSFDPAFSADAQQAALMMYAQNALNHYPPPSFACYSAAGYNGASNSNLALGSGPGAGADGPRAIRLYMEDSGVGNEIAGHRRWILYPPQSSMGSGSTCCSNALFVQGGRAAPGPPPAWVSWPTPGYFPFQSEPAGRWSLSASNAGTDFSRAQVSVVSNGVPLPVTVESVVNGYGSPTLVWELAPGYAPGRADRAYDVSVTNIIQNGVPVSHQYTVTLFDAEINADQTISFPAPADRIYGAPPATAAATATSGLPVTFTSTTPAVCSAGGDNGATITLVGAGTCSIQADQPGDAIRKPAPPVLQSFTVAKKALTVTAVDAARRIGTANPALTVTYAGFAYGQVLATSGVTGAPSCTTTATPASPAGTYPISCAPGTLASGSYTFTLVSGTLTVEADQPPLFTAARPPASAAVGTAYGPYVFAASGRPAPTFVVASGSLPNGLSLDAATGVLSGTPTAAGSSTFTVRATNGAVPDAVSPGITITVGQVATVVSTVQYTLAGSDGSTWQQMDPSRLQLTVSPAGPVTAQIVANVDLWTWNAGFNQDVAVFVDGSLAAWKESGGSAGTFSPNAATVVASVPLSAGPHVIGLRWKTNRPDPFGKISAGAGPLGGAYSPTTLTAILRPAT